MSVSTPQLARTSRGVVEGRWRWWYAAIVDYRMAHPGCKLAEVAAHMKKHPNTIWAITNTDLFRDYEAQRLQEFRNRADQDLRLRLTGVATRALEALEGGLKTKGDQVPLGLANEIAVSALDRLGFAPQKGPTVVVNSQQNNNVVLPGAVTAQALEEARQALRNSERQRTVQQLQLQDTGEQDAENVSVQIEVEAELDAVSSPRLETLREGSDASS